MNLMMLMRRYCHCLLAAAMCGTPVFAIGTLVAGATTNGFHPHDSRVFKTTACTKDHTPVEALYYIAASRSDMAGGKPSPTSQFMKQEVHHNWEEIASRLTKDEVVEQRFTDTYSAVLNQAIPLLEQVVKEKSGVSVFVSEVNSRLMEPSKDQDVPDCRPH